MVWFQKKDRGPKGDNVKKEIPDGLWVKCKSCEEIIYKKQLEKKSWLCPNCGFHFRIGIGKYIDIIMDKDSFEEKDGNIVSKDPLKFYDSKPYPERIEKAKAKSGKNEAVTVGLGKISGIQVSAGFMDFSFIGGSMGSVVGERIKRAIERAYDLETPFIMVCASGGARMQESILSLMQMAKTSAYLTLLDKKKLPYITVLTNPTMAGVMASYASLGDIIIAEPGALLGFAGPRVIKETIGGTLPDGFQTSEFFMEHGFLDIVAKRSELKDIISKLIKYTYSSK